MKYVNHACCQSGNCKLELWKIGHIIAYCLFSKNKPIPTNTELTYSYFNGKFDSNKNRDLLPVKLDLIQFHKLVNLFKWKFYY